MNKLLILSLVESLYLIYTFHFLRTSVDFNIFSSPDHWAFKHLVGNEKGLRICSFGRVAIIALIGILLLRNFIVIPKNMMIVILIITFLLSLMNMNAVVYMLPIFLSESLILNNLILF